MFLAEPWHFHFILFGYSNQLYKQLKGIGPPSLFKILIQIISMLSLASYYPVLSILTNYYLRNILNLYLVFISTKFYESQMFAVACSNFSINYYTLHQNHLNLFNSSSSMHINLFVVWKTLGVLFCSILLSVKPWVSNKLRCPLRNGLK